MAASNQLDPTRILLLLLGAVVLLPLLTMGLGFGGAMGHGGMMGQYGSTGGWWPVMATFVPLVFLVVLLGGGTLLFRRLGDRQASHDPAIEELRLAYARGDLTDEEFEARRNNLEGKE
jgi:putative membrane protein